VRITDEQIELIRQATNIVDLIGESVNLKKRGANWIGLCPFHNEKSPSFNVRDDKGIFKCFGCGKGGDAFTFLMEREALTFPEAAKKLAERANIKLEDATEEEKEAQSESERVHNAIRTVAGWYYRALRAPIGEEPLKYMHRRGFGEDILKRFGIGYAPDSPGALIRAVQKKGYDIAYLEKAGITAKAQGRDYFERFRGRIIFPVFSPTGRIIGFGGRIYTDAQKKQELAKYINSPDSPVYHKSEVLYGLYQSKDSIRKLDQAILVEGYLDVMSLHQAGIENVVAASGTALTKQQLSLLSRYTKSIYLVFDADAAGRAAASKGIDLALRAGFDVYVVVLPKGEDPDSFIQKNDARAFRDRIATAESFIEAKAKWFEESGAFEDATKRAAAVRSIVDSIRQIPDRIKQVTFSNVVSQKFRIALEALYGEINAPTAETRRDRRERLEQQQATASAEPLNVDSQQRYIRTLLRALLTAPTVVAEVIWNEGFDLDQINEPLSRTLIATILERVRQGDSNEFSELLALYASQDYMQQLLVESAMETEAEPDEESIERARNQASDAIFRLLFAESKQHLKRLQANASAMNSEQFYAEHLFHTERLKRLDLLLRRHSDPVE
jgi:DNA primase